MLKQTRSWYVNTITRKSYRLNLTDSQVPLFKKDTDGTPLKANLVMGRRNWCQVEWDQPSGDLIFDIRVERAQGHGNSVRYVPSLPHRFYLQLTHFFKAML